MVSVIPMSPRELRAWRRQKVSDVLSRAQRGTAIDAYAIQRRLQRKTDQPWPLSIIRTVLLDLRALTENPADSGSEYVLCRIQVVPCDWSAQDRWIWIRRRPTPTASD